MLIPIADPPSRLRVVAYDSRSPKHANQYPVYETRLGPGERHRLLNDVQTCCDPSANQLATWWPVDGMRLIWHHNG